MNIFDDFDSGCDSHWTQVTTGGAKLSVASSILRLGYEGATAEKYTDAQIDDYTMLSRGEYMWKPPLRMTVKARYSHSSATAKTQKEDNVLRGTAGFGFWNKPFTMQGRWFTFPKSVWFFYSAPPSNMNLTPNIPGWGWKAQVVCTTPWRIFRNVIPLAATALYAKLSSQSGPAAKWLQRFTGTEEALIEPDMTQWHTYVLEWREQGAAFYIDDKLVLQTAEAPKCALGYVLWLDNEFAVVTPKGELQFGKTNTGTQWLDVDSVKIEEL